jgi:hypothetical protein
MPARRVRAGSKKGRSSDRGFIMRRPFRATRVCRATTVEPLEGRLLMAIVAVLNTSDSGAGSLRAAINAAVDGDVIQFDAGASGEIGLTSELFIDKTLTIHGLGTTATRLSGLGQNRVFNIAAGASVDIDSLTVMNGGGVANGGGISNAGSLSLTLVDVTGNQASSSGGGIYNAGSLTLTACTVAGNSVVATLDAPTAAGGGVASDSAGGVVTITDSTFADNAVALDPSLGTLASAAHVRGGGLAFAGSEDVTLTNITVSANLANSFTGDEETAAHTTAAEGGGIAFAGVGAIALMNCTIAYNRAGSFSADGDAPDANLATSTGGGGHFHDQGVVTVTNSIIANNTAVNATDVANVSSNSTFQNNLIRNADGADGIASNANVIGSADAPIDAKLAPLALNGAATMTHALLPGTPALDAGRTSGAPMTDQRGFIRSTIPDLGAYELGALNATPVFTSTPNDTDVTADQPFTYNITATDADGDVVTISASDLPAWLTLVDHGDGTATLEGTPSNAAAGENMVRLTVADGENSAQQNFTLTVAAINHAPTLPGGPVAAAVAGAPFALTVTGQDVDNQLLSFAIVSKPDWLTVTDNADNTATITGNPTAFEGGMHQVVLQISDGLLVAEQVVEIEVVVPRWTFDNGILGVNGDSADNVINVWFVDDDTIRVIRDGVIKNFPAADVRQIEIYGYDGNDFVSVNSRQVPAYVLGGAGNDTLAGGDEADNLVGGGGKDDLNGGGGDDRLDGQGANDRLAGGDGDDRLLGGDGDDRLCGGAGSDDLRGEAGDDVLYSRGDLIADLLIGGDGDDFAESDFLVDQHADELTPLLPMPMPLIG